MMSLQIPQDLTCPICMSFFKIPITTQCGHSFCRSCLINSAKTKKVCPICRQQFQFSPEKLKQDDTLSHILQDVIVQSISIVKKKQDTSFESQGEKMLLLDVKTNDLLLPYNKVIVSFQLQNPILLNKRQKLVARQQYPYNRNLFFIKKIEYGVISKIISLNKLRHNLYECTLQGKAFCLIEQDTIQQGISQIQQQYFYRTCKAKQIIQTSNINPKQFQPVIRKLKQLQNQQTLQLIYKQIDRSVFMNATDPLAMMYSVFGILNLTDEEKYRVLTMFDEERRVQVIKQVIKKARENGGGLFRVKHSKNSVFGTVMFFIIVFLIIFWVNRKDIGQM